MDQVGGFVSTPPRSATPATDSTPTGAAATGAAGAALASADPSTGGAGAGGGESSEAKARGLDDEVASLVGGFTSFWGKVKKQSVAALHEAEKQYETARADLSPLLNQARTQLDHLSEQTRAEIQRLSEAPAPTTGSDVIIGPDGIPIVLDEVPATPAAPTINEKGKGVERGEGGRDKGAPDAEAAGSFDDTTESHQATQQTPAAAASAFFAKWQSQLASNPNVKDLSRNISSLQSNLSTNLHQIQNQLTHLDLTEGQKVADRYLHKGEAWFQEFSAEVAHLAKEAVKVVPPTGGGGGVTGSTTTTGRSGFERSGTPVMTRRDMVMHKLRTDTSLLLLDPAQPPSSSSSPHSTSDLSASSSAALMMNPDTREAYAAFLSSVQARGGLDGDAFRADVERELLDSGEVLAQTRDQLVPAQIPEEVFWARYFFRKQCVEEEEERRKKVLQVAQQDDDDFSWDMDDEESVASPRVAQEPAMSALAVPPASSSESASPTSAAETTPTAPSAAAAIIPASEPITTKQAATASGSAGPVSAPPVRAVSAETSPTTSSERSPRASSDGGTSSFDIVGEMSGHPSADEMLEKPQRSSGATAAAAAAAGTGIGAGVAPQEEEEDDDSDWE